MREHLIGIGLFFGRVLLVTIVGATILVGLVFGFDNTTVSRALPEIFLLMIAVPLVVTATYQVIIHDVELSCMSGMMVGMTTGMISGFLLGYIVGATNGLFMGSVVGIFVGGAIGIITGRCCGIMGVLEGAMAGLMAGTMGPMLSVMLINDHYRAFTWFFFAVCATILAMLSVMVEREFKAMGRKPTRHILRGSERSALLGSVIITTLLISVIILAPRGPLTILGI